MGHMSRRGRLNRSSVGFAAMAGLTLISIDRAAAETEAEIYLRDCVWVEHRSHGISTRDRRSTGLAASSILRPLGSSSNGNTPTSSIS